MSVSEYDVIVVGGGLAGVSIAFELAHDRRVCVLEMESTLAYHTTGRSAATYLETYGGPEVIALTSSSRAFLEHPPEFFEQVLMHPRPFLQFAKPGRESVVADLHSMVEPIVPEARLVSATEAVAIFPLLAPDCVSIGLFEPDASDLDVHAIHQGYVRGARLRGTEVVKSSAVSRLERLGETWSVETSDGVVRAAPVVVNAAGAWADVVATLAGMPPVGMSPLRRSVFMVQSPVGLDSERLPLLADADQSFYVKPEGVQFLCSPADETPVEPGDAAPDVLEIARALEEINAATTIGAKSVSSTWAGLRTVAPDDNFVFGWDRSDEGFFWFAGQGGYGIQSAPAAARLGAALLRGEAVPADISDRGFEVEKVAPGRLTRGVDVAM